MTEQKIKDWLNKGNGQPGLRDREEGNKKWQKAERKRDTSKLSRQAKEQWRKTKMLPGNKKKKDLSKDREKKGGEIH